MLTCFLSFLFFFLATTPSKPWQPYSFPFIFILFFLHTCVCGRDLEPRTKIPSFFFIIIFLLAKCVCGRECKEEQEKKKKKKKEQEEEKNRRKVWKLEVLKILELKLDLGGIINTRLV